MYNDLISIIVPVYNCEEYLPSFLDSVLNQSYSKWEMICVDDGSKDNSREIISAYSQKDNRIECIESEHINAGNARNLGLKAAKGEWICFLDSDDICEPEFLEGLLSAAKEYNGDIAVCKAEYFTSLPSESEPMDWSICWHRLPLLEEGGFSPKDCPDTLFQTMVLSPWNKLFSASLLKNNGIHAQSQLAANDIVLVCSALSCANRIIPINRSLYKQRRGNLYSITGNRGTREKHLCGYYASEKLLAELKRLGTYELVEKSFLTLAIHNCIWYLNTTYNDQKLFYENYTFLHLEGFQKLGIDQVSYFVQENYPDVKEYDMYEMVRDLRIDEYYRKQYFQAVAIADYASKSLDAVFHSPTFQVGKAVLYLPRTIKKIIRGAQKAYHEKQEDKVRKAAPKRIAILAFEQYHYNVVENIIQICNPKTNWIDVYTHLLEKNEISTLMGLKAEYVHWHWFECPNLRCQVLPNTSPREIIDLFVKHVLVQEDLDYVILPNAEYHPNWYLPLVKNRDRKYKSVVMLHNLNGTLFSDKRKEITQHITEGADVYSVIDSTLASYIRSKSIKKEVMLFPQVYDDTTYDYVPSDRLTLVVTGSVESERKDYQLLVNAMQKLDGYYGCIRLVFLGRAIGSYAESICHQLDECVKNGLELVTYRDYVSTDVFNEEIKKATFLVAPIISETIYKGVTEQYGKTKVSGTIGDLIRYARPGILSSQIIISPELRSSVISFSDSNELANKIISVIPVEEREKYINRARKNSEQFLLSNLMWDKVD